ncbi:hypothetical protein VTN02DRAFT_556 [Thermoascus thermophilus]
MTLHRHGHGHGHARGMHSDPRSKAMRNRLKYAEGNHWGGTGIRGRSMEISSAVPADHGDVIPGQGSASYTRVVGDGSNRPSATTRSMDLDDMKTRVATLVDVVDSSRTVGHVPVSTLPAAVSSPVLGTATIPAETSSPILVSSLSTPSGFPSPSSGHFSSLTSTIPTLTQSSHLPTVSNHSTPSISFSSQTTAPQPSVVSTFSSSAAASTLVASSASSTSSSGSFTTATATTTTATATATASPSSASSSSSTSSTSSSFSSSLTTTSSSTSSTASSESTTSTGSSASNRWSTGVVGGPLTGSPSGGPPSSPTQAQSSGSGSPGVVNTPRIVGGVVGGVAGAAVLCLLALLLLRWRRQHARRPRGELPSGGAVRDAPAAQGSASRPADIMSHRSSLTPLAAAAALSPMGVINRWRQSTMTTSTTETAPSETGFQKISGRKIRPALQTGGDGYGDDEPPLAESPGPSPASNIQSPSSPSSFPVHVVPPPASQSAPTGPQSPSLAVSTARENEEESDGLAVMRPSPARTPVACSSSLAAPGQSMPPNQTRAPLMPTRPDGLGRSHPSFDGSRGSRFTESL